MSFHLVGHPNAHREAMQAVLNMRRGADHNPDAPKPDKPFKFGKPADQNAVHIMPFPAAMPPPAPVPPHDEFGQRRDFALQKQTHMPYVQPPYNPAQANVPNGGTFGMAPPNIARQRAYMQLVQRQHPDWGFKPTINNFTMPYDRNNRPLPQYAIPPGIELYSS